MAEPLLELSRVTKSFGSTRALSDVSLRVQPGEVHVLAGGNGAGKSTLIRILSGAITDFEGELRVSGTPTRFRDPSGATRAGIATIHQELSLVPELSVTDNLFLGERRALLAPWRENQGSDRARELLAAVGLELDPARGVESLSLPERQLVEIARALRHAARVLVLDEPTSSLSEPETQALFLRIDELARQGKGIVFISHRMDEIFRIGSRVSVLRDGSLVHSGPPNELDRERLVELMVGRTLETAPAATATSGAGEPLLTLRRFGARTAERPPSFEDVSLTLTPGEIVGLAGLQGSGASELLLALFDGSALELEGEVSRQGARYDPEGPEHALASGVCYLAADRKASVLPELRISENATLSNLGFYSRFGFVARVRELEDTKAASRGLALVASGPEARTGSLSGGNQQKVALTRCFLAKPQVLLLDDPTRGIDVAAKADVHAWIRKQCGTGSGVLVASTDLDELVGLCHRILVFFRGRVRAEVSGARASSARLLALCMGAEDDAA